MLITISEFAIQTVWYISKQTYYLGRYIIYGHQETEAEKIQKLENLLVKQQEELNELREEIMEEKINKEELEPLDISGILPIN